MRPNRFVLLAAIAALATPAMATAAAPPKPPTTEITVKFPRGTATPDEECGVCHRTTFNEYHFGYERIAVSSQEDHSKPPVAPASASTTRKAMSPEIPSHGPEAESLGLACGSCHAPEPFAMPEMDLADAVRPKGKKEADGKMTCATCHLTPEGKIRGPYNLRAPHEIFSDVKMKTSLLCAPCHALGKRVPGKQTQTFLEWRDDYFRTGIGNQNCQGCHMTKTLRKLTEEAVAPMRVGARHSAIGGKAALRLHNALTQVVVQPTTGATFEIHLTNVGAGHSIPTGAARKAVIVTAEAKNEEGKVVATQKWLFAPWYASRPDDKKHLEADKKLPHAKMAMMADAQGPHEAPVRAGEERILLWKPELRPGKYTITSKIISDSNRFGDRNDIARLVEVDVKTMSVTVTPAEQQGVKKQ